jgi:cytidine deaminase
MKELKFEYSFQQFQGNELSAEDVKLVEMSRNAAKQAYAPYSKFNVGAAVLLENGEIITSSNQENAAYPSGLCAERVALFYAGAKYPGVAVKKLIITVITENRDNIRLYAPCGGCRQVIAEYEQKQGEKIEILFEGPGDHYTSCSGIEQLLPFTFQLLTK